MLTLKQLIHRYFAFDLFEVILVLQGGIGREQGGKDGLFGLGGLFENGFFEP